MCSWLCLEDKAIAEPEPGGFQGALPVKLSLSVSSEMTLGCA